MLPKAIITMMAALLRLHVLVAATWKPLQSDESSFYHIN